MRAIFQRTYTNIGLLVLRLVAGGILLYEGSVKIFIHGSENVTSYFSGLGFAAPALVGSFISYFELIAGVLIILGILTRLLALAATIEMTVATVMINLPNGLTAATEVTILMLGSFLALALAGSGKYSLENIFIPSKKLYSLLAVLILPVLFMFSLSLTVFAAGGGGGGGGGGTPPPPPCTQDTWSCDDWSTCSIEGEQTRTCTLANNCPTVETPKPAESQSCTPACTQDTWDCSDWSSCSSEGTQARACVLSFDCPLIDSPKPSEFQTCQPDCTQDTWECADFGPCSQNGKQNRKCNLTFDCPLAVSPIPNLVQNCTPPPAPSATPAPAQVASPATCTQDEYSCNDWSQCKQDGQQVRICNLVTDCPRVNTPEPEQSRDCPGIRCGQLDSLEQRINCRLDLTNEELAEEFKILYFPEYCKVEPTTDEQISCIARYQALGPCWQLPVGPDRVECAKDVIKLKDINQEKTNCLNQPGQNRPACTENLKEKVEQLIIFHMYELEVQAESLLAQGQVGQDAVAELELFIETKKQQIETAKNVREWKIIIWQVKDAWEKFIKPLQN